MLKKFMKSIVAIPVYIILVLEGFCGGVGTAKYNDIWQDVVEWIKK